MVSVSASVATAYFNRFMWAQSKQKVALFDSRAFVLPREEACNYFLWRYQDCVRNSVSSLAQTLFSAKQLHGVNIRDMKDMLIDCDVNWEYCPPYQKYGTLMTTDGQISDWFENIKPIIESSLIQKES